MIDLIALIYKNHSNLPDDEKLQIYSFFSEIALSDGNIDPNELNFLNKIADNLKIKNPFDYDDILKKRGKTNQKKEGDQKFDFNEYKDTTRKAGEGIAMIARMIVQSMIEANMIHKSLEIKAVTTAIMVLAENSNLAIKILSKDQSEVGLAFIQSTDLILERMGIGPKPQYSSTIYADTEEELLKKKRAVNFYASLGLLSIFGFLGSFGYAIYLFFNAGNFFLWVIIGFILMFFQKWVGKKHDALTG